MYNIKKSGKAYIACALWQKVVVMFREKTSLRKLLKIKSQNSVSYKEKVFSK